mgnify:CR=1 FL=1
MNNKINIKAPRKLLDLNISRQINGLVDLNFLNWKKYMWKIIIDKKIKYNLLNSFKRPITIKLDKNSV